MKYRLIDNSVCRKYSPYREMICCNHPSALGTVLGHDYVTSFYVNDDIALPDGLKIYGSEEKCGEKEVKFKTKVQLAYGPIEEHKLRAKRTIWLRDSLYTCHDGFEV